ncbi:MAG: alpha amylase C-terminal domain-containing protein, partial [Planctomycetes bacterium]|nr:alpha amylase C-terminal domain-containing protein [Planctomycetota bacterium]
HGKGSLFAKMPGDEWQRLANLRALYGYMYAHPGKKSLFMGGEFGQRREWNHDGSLDWHLLNHPGHGGLQTFVRDLNRLYTSEPALYEMDYSPAGFEWIDCEDHWRSVYSLIRRAKDPEDFVVVVCNFTPVPRFHYRLGVPAPGKYRELLNSDAEVYWGSNLGNFGEVASEEVPSNGHAHSLSLTVPPLGVVVLKKTREAAAPV